MRIALFGISANPPTGLHGHQGMVRRLCQTEMFDEVWIIPVYTHIYPEKRRLLSDFECRIDMCRLCFEEESTLMTTVKVLPIEKDAFQLRNSSTECNGGDSTIYLGTIDIIDYIREKCCNEEDTLTIVLGGDTFMDLINEKWKQSRRLLTENNFFVFGRAGHSNASSLQNVCETSHLLKELSTNIYFDNIEFDTEISSSSFRANILSGYVSVLQNPDIMHPQVIQYIKTHNLYKEN